MLEEQNTECPSERLPLAHKVIQPWICQISTGWSDHQQHSHPKLRRHRDPHTVPCQPPICPVTLDHVLMLPSADVFAWACTEQVAGKWWQSKDGCFGQTTTETEIHLDTGQDWPLEGCICIWYQHLRLQMGGQCESWTDCWLDQSDKCLYGDGSDFIIFHLFVMRTHNSFSVQYVKCLYQHNAVRASEITGIMFP